MQTLKDPISVELKPNPDIQAPDLDYITEGFSSRNKERQVQEIKMKGHTIECPKKIDEIVHEWNNIQNSNMTFEWRIEHKLNLIFALLTLKYHA